MSRAWIAFYMGDYLKDTQALTTEQHGAYMLLLMECWQKGSVPLDASSRAAIARMPLQRWKKICAPIDAFFEEDGTNKRATAEITKAETISTKRAMAGAAGGRRSGISKAIARGQQSKVEANAIAKRQQIGLQTPLQNGGNCEATHNSKFINTSFVAAREGVEDKPLSPETNRLLESLERLRLAKQQTAAPHDPIEQGKFWVDHGSPEWSAHNHQASVRKVRMRLPIKRTDDQGVERTGAYFDSLVPEGYDEATGERIAPSEENAA